MKRTLIFVGLSTAYVALSLAWSKQATLESAKGDSCSYDRAALLTLDESAFDQDMDGGWRALARQDECLEVAADLIRDYRETRALDSPILYWHEGQLRAAVGATEQAIRLFEMARKPKDEDRIGWNLYVDATIAFLKQDRAGLERAREALARLPQPEDFAPRDVSGNPMDIPWPPNLNIVDMLIECFGREYEEAYGHCEK